MSRVAILGVFALALTSAAGSSWAQGNVPQSTVAGTVAYRERMALPPDAAIDVSLVDASSQSASTKVIGESVFAAAGQQVPISFQVSYSPAAVNPAHTYLLRANITINGTKIFASAAPYPVITNGAPMQANITLLPVQELTPEKSSGPKLHGTYWRLVQLDGRPAAPGMGKAQAYIRLHREQGTLEGSSGCNGVVGSYIVEQNALRLTPSATTMMMCPAALMEQEQALVAALKATSSYKIDEDILELIGGTAVIARFQAAPKD